MKPHRLKVGNYANYFSPRLKRLTSLNSAAASPNTSRNYAGGHDRQRRSHKVKRASLAGLIIAGLLVLSGSLVTAQLFVPKDPGVRGGLANTGGGLQQRGIPIPHPPLLSPNPKTGATVNDNERASFEEGILRAGQLESTCDDCADITDGSPVPGELDPMFPQVHTNSNGLGARHNADQCFICHAHPVLGGSGGFIVPNPGDPVPQPAENPQSVWSLTGSEG